MKRRGLGFEECEQVVHGFSDGLLRSFLSNADDLEKQKFLMAQREIMVEVLAQKYEYNPFTAAVLLLTAASELLQIVRHHEECRHCRDSNLTED